LLRRADGTYIFPGGHVEYAESIDACLKREALEELSYDLEAKPMFFDLYEYIPEDHSKHALILHYLVVLSAKPVFKLGDDEANSEMIWFTKAELAKIIPKPAFIEKAFTS